MKRHQAQGHQHKRKTVKPAYADCRVRCRQRGSSSCVGNRRGRRRVGGRSRCLRRFLLSFLLKCIIGCDLYLAVPTPLFFLWLLLHHPLAVSSHLSPSKDGLCAPVGCPTKCKKRHPTRLHPLLENTLFPARQVAAACCLPQAPPPRLLHQVPLPIISGTIKCRQPMLPNSMGVCRLAEPGSIIK